MLKIFVVVGECAPCYCFGRNYLLWWSVALRSVMVAEGQNQCSEIAIIRTFMWSCSWVSLVVVTCQCPDKPEISIKILNMRPLFWPCLVTFSFNLRLSNLSSLVSVCIGLINGHKNILNSLRLCDCECQAVMFALLSCVDILWTHDDAHSRIAETLDGWL